MMAGVMAVMLTTMVVRMAAVIMMTVVNVLLIILMTVRLVMVMKMILMMRVGVTAVSVDDGDEHGTAPMRKRTEVLPNPKSRSGESAPGHTCRGNANSKRYMHPAAHCSTIYNSQHVQATQAPEDRGWSQKWCTRAMDYSAATKEEEAVPFAATWLNPGIILLTEVSQRKANTSLTCRL